jgi:hypothetical protein
VAQVSFQASSGREGQHSGRSLILVLGVSVISASHVLALPAIGTMGRGIG